MKMYRRTVPEIVDEVLKRREQHQPTEGVIHAIDGDRVDLRINSSSGVLRYVEVVGSLGNVNIGDTVPIRWRLDRPVVMLLSDGTIEGSSGLQRVVADNQSIENSSAGLRVKVGGIALDHLSFLPALEGHQHQLEDPFSKAGWKVSDAGTIWQGDTYIHPDGQIALGTGANSIKLSSNDPDYRIWGGAVVPEVNEDGVFLGKFALKADGSIIARLGEIAGWVIAEDYLEAPGSIKLQSDGDATFGSDITAVATTVLKIFSNAQSWDGEAFGAGDIHIGDHAAANMLWDASAGQLQFRGAEVVEAYVDTDGKIYAGGGDVLLSSDGLSLWAGDDSPALQGHVNWFNDSDLKIGATYTYYVTSTDTLTYVIATVATPTKALRSKMEFKLETYDTDDNYHQMVPFFWMESPGTTADPLIDFEYNFPNPKAGGTIFTMTSALIAFNAALANVDFTVHGDAISDVLRVDAGLDAVQFANYVMFKQIAAPGAPASTWGNLYHKTGDDGLFWHPNGGSEVDLTAAGSGGGLWTDNTTWIVPIDTTDAVTIGADTAPDGVLHVFDGSAGTVSADGSADTVVIESSGDGGLSILVPDASWAGIYFGSPAAAKGAWLSYNQSTLTFGFEGPAGGAMRFNGLLENVDYIFSGDTEQYLLVLDAGTDKVIIGGNVPIYDLTIGDGAGDPAFTIFSGTANLGSITFADGSTGADRYRGWIEYNHDGDTLGLGAGGAEIMQLKAGQVGIGGAPTEDFSIIVEGAYANMDLWGYATRATASFASWTGYLLGGTVASPTKTLVGDSLFLGMRGYEENTPGITNTTAYIALKASEDYSSTTQGSYFEFAAVPEGSATRSPAMRLWGEGHISSFGGTSNPTTNISAGSIFYRTDLQMWIEYDGTRWLTVQEYSFTHGDYRAISGSGSTAMEWVVRTDYAPYVTRISFSVRAGAVTGSNYWVIVIEGENEARDTTTTIWQFDQSSDDSYVWTHHETSSPTTPNPTNKHWIGAYCTKTGSPNDLHINGTICYKLIIT